MVAESIEALDSFTAQNAWLFPPEPDQSPQFGQRLPIESQNDLPEHLLFYWAFVGAYSAVLAARARGDLAAALAGALRVAGLLAPVLLAAVLPEPALLALAGVSMAIADSKVGSGSVLFNRIRFLPH